jgi:hypothetical protein
MSTGSTVFIDSVKALFIVIFLNIPGFKPESLKSLRHKGLAKYE